MPSPIIPMLLAGGAGTRLWPVSRDALPKQFLPLVGNRSTYQETLLRVQDAMFGPPIVITGPNFHFLRAARQRTSVSRPQSSSSRCGAIQGRQLQRQLWTLL